MGGPEAIGHRDPSRPVQQARGGLVRVGAVQPGHQREVLPHRRGRRERPLELRDHERGSLPGRRTSSVGRSKGMGRSR